MLPIFSVAWHWMLKTCIQLSITRVESLHSVYSFAVCTRLWQYGEREPQTNNSVMGLLLNKPWVVVPSPREIAGTVWISIDVTNLSGQSFQRRNPHDEGMSKSIYMDLVYGKEVTMARAGTLPDFLYQKEIEVGERIFLQIVWQPQTSAQYPASLRGFVHSVNRHIMFLSNHPTGRTVILITDLLTARSKFFAIC